MKNYIFKKIANDVIKDFLHSLYELHYFDFFLSGGALIGLFREKNLFISDDIDFTTKEEKLKKKIFLISALLKKRGFKVEYKKNILRLHCYKNGIKISIASMRTKGEYRVSRFHRLPEIIFNRVKLKNYENVKIPISIYSIKYLKFVYSNWRVKNNSNFFYNFRYYRIDSIFYLKRFLNRVFRRITD